VLADKGSVCWQVGNYVDAGEVVPLDILFYPVFKGLGLKLRNRVVWHFDHGLHAKNRLSGRYETLLWFTHEGAESPYAEGTTPVMLCEQGSPL
jgi:hypothetical protein